jgi:hypothetical protein
MIVAMMVALVVGFGIGGVAGFFRNHSLDDLEPETPTENRVVSMFEFTGVTGWRQGPHNETSMALFGTAREDGTSACFVSTEYKSGDVDIEAELRKQQQDFVKMGGSMSETAIVSSTLQTNDGERQYELHQYKASGGSDEKLMGGLELGYVQVKNGYVKVEGHCETAEGLSTTIPALQAYKLLQ